MSVTQRAGAGDRPGFLRRVAANVAQMVALLTRAPRGPDCPPWRATQVLAIVGLSALVVGVLMAFVDVHTVAVARHVPPTLQSVLSFLTDFGKSGWILIPLAAALALVAVMNTATLTHMSRLVLLSITVRVSFLFLAIAVPSLFTSIVKRLIGRGRPYVDPNGNPFHFQSFVWRADYASMPSGHATTAVAAAFAIGLLWPRWRVPMAVYALTIMASRVLLSAHYPSDVIAAAVVGGVGALLVRDWFAARRLGFAIDVTGRIVVLPGPSFRRIKRVARRLPGP